MSSLYLVPDRASDDARFLEQGERSRARLRADGFEPCESCEDWQPVDGSRKRPPMRLVGKDRYMCERCFRAALEQASEIEFASGCGAYGGAWPTRSQKTTAAGAPYTGGPLAPLSDATPILLRAEASDHTRALCLSSAPACPLERAG